MVDIRLSAAHVVEMLASMRHLRKLRLWLPNVRSLSFLADPALAHLGETLRELHLNHCQLGSPASEDPLAPLRRLRSLETLFLDQCFPEASPLASATIAELTPGADGFLIDVWPRLRTVRLS